jgi:hypothetical protein
MKERNQQTEESPALTGENILENKESTDETERQQKKKHKRERPPKKNLSEDKKLKDEGKKIEFY